MNKPRFQKHSKNSVLKYTFGITLDQYNKILDKQKGVCVICGNPETKKVKGTVCYLSVDHSHTTGKIRGLLCDNCNGGLGKFKDNFKLLLSAISYLKNNE